MRISGVVLTVATLRPLNTAITTPDPEISKDGGAFANIAGTFADIGTTGFWTVDFTSADTACDTLLFQLKHGDAGADFPTREIKFEPAIDSGLAQAGTGAQIQLRSGNSLADDQPNGCVVEITAGTGAGQTRVIIDFVASTEVATLDKDWVTNLDTTSVYIIHPRRQGGVTDVGSIVANMADIRNVGGFSSPTTTTGGLRALCLSNVPSTVVSGASVNGFVSGFSGSTTDFFRFSAFSFMSGVLRGRTFQISSYNSGTGAITVFPQMPVAPTNGDEIMLHGLFV